MGFHLDMTGPMLTAESVELMSSRTTFSFLWEKSIFALRFVIFWLSNVQRLPLAVFNGNLIFIGKKGQWKGSELRWENGIEKGHPVY